jgi:hypothetical protein
MLGESEWCAALATTIGSLLAFLGLGDFFFGIIPLTNPELT